MATVRHVHNILSGAFRSAVKAGLMSVNPCTLAEVPSGKAAPKRKPTVWTPEELRTFLVAEEGSEHYPLWLLIAATGCRRGEALGLTWERVDLDAGTALVLETVGVQRGWIVREAVPKGKEGRTVHLPAVVIAALRAHRKDQSAERLRLGPRWVDEGLVFPRSGYRLYDGMTAGGPANGDKITEAFKRAAKRAGLPVIRLHDMRHGLATSALQAGVPVKAVQQQLGHASYHVTMNVYSHVVDAVAKDASETVSRLFLGETAV